MGPMEFPLPEILYEDGPCVVVCKPSGLLTQAPPGVDSMEVRLKEHLKQRDGKTGNTYLGVPHRLDRPASGVMVFARHCRATRRLCEQFEARIVIKIYWACTEGMVAPAAGSWQDTLRKVPGEARAELVAADHEQGRSAILQYQTIGQSASGSWLEIQLETGRTHQVRVQAASRGWPLLGDEQYGAQIPFGPQSQDRRLCGIALHARSLTFFHPMTREEVVIVAPLPAAWNHVGLARTTNLKDR